MIFKRRNSINIIQKYKNKSTIDIPNFPSANKVLPRAWGDVVKQIRHTVVHTDDCTDTGILFKYVIVSVGM